MNYSDPRPETLVSNEKLSLSPGQMQIGQRIEQWFPGPGGWAAGGCGVVVLKSPLCKMKEF